jgi:hypothetical protein
MCTAICSDVRNWVAKWGIANCTYFVIEINKGLQRCLIGIKRDALHSMFKRVVFQLDLNIPGSGSLRRYGRGIYHIRKDDGVRRHEEPVYNFR